MTTTSESTTGRVEAALETRANASADVSRYQAPGVRAGSLVLSAAAGAGIPLVLLISLGSMLAAGDPSRLATLAGPTVLIDPGPLVGEIDLDAWTRVLAGTSILSTNAREAHILTGETDRWEASAKLARRLPATAAVIVRDGSAGCLVTHNDTTTHVPGIPVEAVDTTGAGDAHCGVLAAELLRGADLTGAAARANAAAALAVTRPGPATAPSRAEVDLLLARTS